MGCFTIKLRENLCASVVLHAMWNLCSDAQTPQIGNWERRRPRRHLMTDADEDVGAPNVISMLRASVANLQPRAGMMPK